MDGEVAGAGVEDHRAVEPVVDRGDGAARLVSHARSGHAAGPSALTGNPELRSALRRARQRIGNAVVGGVDHAADRLRAPAQGRRSAHHLDPVGRQRIERHGVILAQLRDAARADAVFLDAHPIGVEAAHDRAARCARRKARAGDAGLGEQHVAECAAGVRCNLLAGDHRDGGELVGDDRQPARGGSLGRRGGSGRRCGRCRRRARAPAARAAGRSGSARDHDFGQTGLGWRRPRGRNQTPTRLDAAPGPEATTPTHDTPAG